MTRRQIAILISVNALLSLLIAIAVVWASSRLGWLGSPPQPTPYVIIPPTPTLVPTPGPARPVTPSPTLATELYVVQPGDTLLGIALRLDVDPDLLLALNGIANADRLLVGQALQVPLGSLPTATATTTATAAATATPTATPSIPLPTEPATATITATITSTVTGA